ncbi:segregation/condensation protein A [Candidatus Parcubacteria bacterium]|nr:segregation/condensation protein A [Candidatus Parcubacteria bacterium]
MLNIKLEKFEGPLSLLLRLIEKEKMDVTQVSLANAADQYVSYIRESKNIIPEEMADFLVVAARLLLIKSKALLPYLYPEEEEDIQDFEDQLKMYREFLNATQRLEKILRKKKFMFAREFNREFVLNQTNSFSPPKNTKAKDIKNAFSDLLFRSRPAKKLEEEILDRRINIEDKIISIQNSLLNRVNMSFNKVIAGAKNKTEIVVSFLAVLELMRQREVILKQNGLFTEILIEKI